MINLQCAKGLTYFSTLLYSFSRRSLDYRFKTGSMMSTIFRSCREGLFCCICGAPGPAFNGSGATDTEAAISTDQTTDSSLESTPRRRHSDSRTDSDLSTIVRISPGFARAVVALPIFNFSPEGMEEDAGEGAGLLRSRRRKFHGESEQDDYGNLPGGGLCPERFGKSPPLALYSPRGDQGGRR